MTGGCRVQSPRRKSLLQHSRVQALRSHDVAAHLLELTGSTTVTAATAVHWLLCWAEVSRWCPSRRPPWMHRDLKSPNVLLSRSAPPHGFARLVPSCWQSCLGATDRCLSAPPVAVDGAAARPASCEACQSV